MDIQVNCELKTNISSIFLDTSFILQSLILNHISFHLFEYESYEMQESHKINYEVNNVGSLESVKQTEMVWYGFTSIIRIQSLSTP